MLMWLKKLYWHFDLRKFLTLCSIIVIAVLAVLPFFTEKKVRYLPCQVHPSAHNFDRFKGDNSGPPFQDEIVPNIIHFYRTGKDINDFTFTDAICLLAAFRFTNPRKIMIHTEDVLAVTNIFTKSLYGKRLMEFPGFKKVLTIQYWPTPKHVFGIEFTNNYREEHIKDITRLRILRKYGGIFFNNNIFLMKHLKQMCNYEMVITENKGQISNNLIIAHRDSRMLDLWLKSYHRYDPEIKIHHNTDYVKSLFSQKYTFYHKFENSIQDGNVNMLTGDTGLQLKGSEDCYAIHVHSTKLKETDSENFDVGFESNLILSLVDKYFNNNY